MATADSVKAKIQGLIASANSKTGNNDADLTTAVNTLISGFGLGEGELPTLTNPGSADDLVSGKQLIGADGSVVEGSVPVGSDWGSGLYKHFEQSELRNPYEPDDENYYLTLDMVAKNDVLVRGGAKLPIYIWGDKLGTAKPEDVAQGVTFTSENGLKIEGSLPTPNGVSAICYMVEGGNNNTFAVEGSITEDVILRKDKFVNMVVDPSKFSDFGTAKPEDVRAGVTFTSAAGYAMRGALEAGSGGGGSSGGASGIYMAKVTPATSKDRMVITHNLGTTDILMAAVFVETFGDNPIGEVTATIGGFWAKADMLGLRGGLGYDIKFTWAKTQISNSAPQTAGSYLNINNENQVTFNGASASGAYNFPVGVTHTVIIIPASAFKETEG